MMDNFHQYSVRVKNGSGWRAYSAVRLMVSVGQPYHEGDKLAAVVRWINRNPQISFVHISVNDTLQRHNFVAGGLSPEEAFYFATAQGALWLSHNEEIFSDIKAEKLITRWNEWLFHSDFAAAHQAISDYALSDPAFNESIKADSRALLERKKVRHEPLSDEENFLKCSELYLREELAVFALQSRHLPGAEVYPGSNLSSAKYLLGKKLPKKISSLANRYFTRIDFARVSPEVVAQNPYERSWHRL